MENRLKNILLVDDDDTSNFINEMIIGRAQLTETLTIFTCASEALAYLKDTDTCPELILLDINMPYLDGWDFLDIYFGEGIDQEGRTLICMLSSSIYQSDKKRALNYGKNVEFISKPLSEASIKQLTNRIRSSNQHLAI